MRFIFIAFVVVPIIEMWVLIKVGGALGAPLTILLVLATAVIGVGLLRAQGISTLLRAQQRLAAGQLPANEFAEGVMLAVGGALLLTPGFVTDTVGLACLIPGIRQFAVSLIFERLRERGMRRQAQSSERTQARSERVIEGEFHKED